MILKMYGKNLKLTEISNLMKNASSGSCVFPCGRKDRQTNKQIDTYGEANSHFSHFRARA